MSADPDRTMEDTLQHQTTPQCFGLPPTCSGNHRPDGPKASHAPTIKLGHSGGGTSLLTPWRCNDKVSNRSVLEEDRQTADGDDQEEHGHNPA